MNRTTFLPALILSASIFTASAQSDTSVYHEQYRPRVHFSPKEHWMNDPNGMVYDHGLYHLFFQYYPGGTVWGPMHWGHATSADLVHWTEQKIALYPDSIGYIFSGSAVYDAHNTSGLGKNGRAPLVAIYTSHDSKREKAGATNYQNQSIAYSNDNGKTWIKYKKNPVLKNPGITDFRDPKVSWYEKDKKWVMTLATKDRITFFSSPDLKDWKKESEFGEKLGAHGGVWECPDLFPMDLEGSQVWVLVVNINPGGPNGGSATQYFTGSFDGHTFTPDKDGNKWLDYGPDEYAGVTWSNTGSRRIFLGWMSNWDYATKVPTQRWRSAMTVPRELGLMKVNDSTLITSMPVKEIDGIATTLKKASDVKLSSDGSAIAEKLDGAYELTVDCDEARDFSFVFSNDSGEQLLMGYDKSMDQYYIDRSDAGRSDFKKTFASKAVAPRFSTGNNLRFTAIIDNASIELFADGGLTTMTSIFFPKQLLGNISARSADGLTIKTIEVKKLRGIWK